MKNKSEDSGCMYASDIPAKAFKGGGKAIKNYINDIYNKEVKRVRKIWKGGGFNLPT